MAELTDADKEFIKELREAREQGHINRRQALGLLAGIGIGGAAGYAGVDRAAASNHNDSDGNVGTDSDRVDVFADTIDTTNAIIGDTSEAPTLAQARITQELKIRPSGGDKVGSAFLHPSGSDDRSHWSLANDSDYENFGLVQFELDGKIASIETGTKGNGGAVGLPTELDLTDFQDPTKVKYLQWSENSVTLNKNSDQSLTGSSKTTVDWDNQDVDTGLYTYDTSADTVEVLHPGDYRIDFSLRYSGLSDQDRIRFIVDVAGSEARNPFKAASGTNDCILGSVLLKDVAANDKIKISAKSESASTLDGNAGSCYAMISKSG